jgi:antitoxin (DNA-binding transcriptional repressor) of toxin-antitoxin stability system
VIVLDRETPVAKMVPIEGKGGALVVRKATMKWEDIRWPPAPKKPVDSLKVLMELRRDWM